MVCVIFYPTQFSHHKVSYSLINSRIFIAENQGVKAPKINQKKFRVDEIFSGTNQFIGFNPDRFEQKF